MRTKKLIQSLDQINDKLSEVHEDLREDLSIEDSNKLTDIRCKIGALVGRLEGEKIALKSSLTIFIVGLLSAASGFLLSAALGFLLCEYLF